MIQRDGVFEPDHGPSDFANRLADYGRQFAGFGVAPALLGELPGLFADFQRRSAGFAVRRNGRVRRHLVLDRATGHGGRIRLKVEGEPVPGFPLPHRLLNFLSCVAEKILHVHAGGAGLVAEFIPDGLLDDPFDPFRERPGCGLVPGAGQVGQVAVGEGAVGFGGVPEGTGGWGWGLGRHTHSYGAEPGSPAADDDPGSSRI